MLNRHFCIWFHPNYLWFLKLLVWAFAIIFYSQHICFQNWPLLLFSMYLLISEKCVKVTHQWDSKRIPDQMIIVDRDIKTELPMPVGLHSESHQSFVLFVCDSLPLHIVALKCGTLHPGVSSSPICSFCAQESYCIFASQSGCG